MVPRGSTVRAVGSTIGRWCTIRAELGEAHRQEESRAESSERR